MIYSIALTIVILLCMYLAIRYMPGLIPDAFIQNLIQILIVLVAILGILRVWGLV
jgi:hypothetical protein